jgi:hypothetical protein
LIKRGALTLNSMDAWGKIEDWIIKNYVRIFYSDQFCVVFIVRYPSKFIISMTAVFVLYGSPLTIVLSSIYHKCFGLFLRFLHICLFSTQVWHYCG